MVFGKKLWPTEKCRILPRKKGRPGVTPRREEENALLILIAAGRSGEKRCQSVSLRTEARFSETDFRLRSGENLV